MPASGFLPRGWRSLSRLARRGLWPLCVLLTGACAHDWDDPDWQAKVAACDRTVASLLSTQSMVELERSKFIVRRLNCGIAQRLPHARPG